MYILDIWGDYAHFSHPATIYSSLSYPIPSKTAIMGFLGAVGGHKNIIDYQYLNDMKYSVKILNLSGKKTFSFNGVKNTIPSIDKEHKYQRVKQRKQFYREMLVNPKYRIYLDFDGCNGDYTTIITNLKNHISLFTTYLGINSCLANFNYVGEFDSELLKNSEYIEVDSFMKIGSEFKIEGGKNYSDVRIPTIIDENRYFSGFADLLVETRGGTILGSPDEYFMINNESIVMI